MRYGPIADDAFEDQMLASPQAPLALFDSFLPLVQASALMAGVRHGVFEGVRGGPLSATELAGVLVVDPDTLQLVLRVLSASKYLTADDQGRFALTDVARTTLDNGVDRLTAFVGTLDFWWTRFAQMGEVLRSGHGLDFHRELRDPAEWSTYQAAMLEIARRQAPFVASRVPVTPGATRLLEIGGSHGLYGALIARAHPPMLSEVLDLPQAVKHARKLASAEGLDDVVTYRTGDALADDLGEDYDVVFLGNILHHFTPQQIGELLARVRAAMSQGATVAIWDCRQSEADEVEPDLIGDAFSLFFRLTSTARCYTKREFTSWLIDAGFVEVQVQSLPVGRSLILVTGRAP
jgi:hypothetical protein